MIENKYSLWAADRIGEKTRTKKGVIGELLFFLAFLLFYLKHFLDYSRIIGERNETLNSLFLGILFVCLMTKISLQRYTPIRLAFTVIFGSVLGYSCLTSVNNFVFIGILFIIGMQDIAFEKVLRFCFIVKTSNIIIHVLIYIFTYFTNRSAITFVYRGGINATGEPRHYFFMGHANLFTAFLIWTCLDFIVLNYKKLKVLHMTVIWLINLIFYAFTDTNTGVIVLIAVTVLILIDKTGKRLFGSIFDALLTFVAKFTYIFFAALFPFLAVVYTHLDGVLKELWHAIDNALTGRIWFGAYAYDDYGFTILGIKDIAPTLVYWQDRWFDTATVFDNYYIGNFVSYGIINSVAISLAFIILCSKMESIEKILIIAFALYGIMDSGVINVSICSALLILGKYIYPVKSEPTDAPEWLWNKP